MADRQCLVLGPEGVGKTLLTRTLGKMANKRQEVVTLTTPPPTHPTPGTNFTILTVGTETVRLKEYGSKMAPLWPKAFPEADRLLYLFDASNPTQLSQATILLIETLSHEMTQGKPVAIFFNKTDLPSSLSMEEVMGIVRTSDLEKKYGQQIAIFKGSCVNQEGLSDLMQWLL